MFEIVWPEHRFVSDARIRSWYSDALPHGQVTSGLGDVREMALELHEWGHITLGRWRRT